VSFVHETPEEFADLVQIIVGEGGIGRSIIEKDYWVTHVLWALSISGLDVWFKGGTSLSKGFGLVERFSEDLDLKIEPGSVAALPIVSSWKARGRRQPPSDARSSSSSRRCWRSPAVRSRSNRRPSTSRGVARTSAVNGQVFWR
jgi:Nucleotidyl transferase AbiEii toxin, Type IV TA system